MASHHETQVQVQTVLGNALGDCHATFAELDGMADGLDPELDADAIEYIRLFFLPTEDNIGQHRQSAQRQINALRWAMAHHGRVPDWLVRAGIAPVTPAVETVAVEETQAEAEATDAPAPKAKR
jgi:hypothetical protein